MGLHRTELKKESVELIEIIDALIQHLESMKLHIRDLRVVKSMEAACRTLMVQITKRVLEMKE